MATFTSNFSSGWCSLNVEVSTESYSIENNTSYLKCILYIRKLSACQSYNLGGASVSMTINGTTLYSSNSFDVRGQAVGTNQILATKYITINHNSDGNKSISCKGYLASGVGLGTASVSGTFDCVSIPRSATLTAAPNFNDEENPTITYSNPAGNTVEALDVCISLTGSRDDIAYRAVSKTGTSYTFELTEAEREVLRNATTESNTRTVKFYVRTVLGGKTYYSILDKTLTIVNASPTISVIVYNTNETTNALTGNNQTIIKGYNSVYVAQENTAYKGAWIVNAYITNNGKVHDIASGTIYNLENPTISFFTQDSRGNTKTLNYTLKMVNYVPISINVDGKILLSNADTTKADLTFTASGNFFNGSFGAVTNELHLSYELYDGTDTVIDSGVLDMSKASYNGNTYSLTHTINGLDYQKSYVVCVIAGDKLNDGFRGYSKTLKTFPLFDWGEEDFNFNVPVMMNNETVLKYNQDARNLVVSAGGGYIYIRPGGTDDTSSEIRITPQGDIIIGGKSLKGLLGI